MAIQILVLTLPGTDRLPSRYEAALPITLAARPFLFHHLVYCVLLCRAAGYTPGMLDVRLPTASQHPLMPFPAYMGTNSIADAIQTARGQRILWLEILVNDHLDLSPWTSDPSVQKSYQMACRWYTHYRRLLTSLLDREPLPSRIRVPSIIGTTRASQRRPPLSALFAEHVIELLTNYTRQTGASIEVLLVGALALQAYGYHDRLTRVWMQKL